MAPSKSVSLHISSDTGAYPMIGPLLAGNIGRMMGGAPRPAWDRRVAEIGKF